MPNGGTDCCATCWFNRTNKGRRNWRERRDPRIQPHCEIRGLDLEDPFYKYCANHPHRRPFRDRIPIGPVMTGDASGHREHWRDVVDTPEVRQHHIDILYDAADNYYSGGNYPLGIGLLQVVSLQLGYWKERRAIPALEALIEADEKYEDLGRSTIDFILKDD